MATSDRNTGSDAAAQPSGAHRSRSHNQQQILDRIALQRERLHSRRAARAQAASAEHAANASQGSDSLVARAVAFAREHPVAVAAGVGLALMAGPARLIRWGTMLLPILIRYKSR